MDCPDTCALEVQVEEGRIRRIRGTRDHPDTAGFICTKVARFGQRVTHADRLLHPLRRVGAKGEGKFDRISWDDAIGEITDRFRQITTTWGAEAILPYRYGGSNGVLSDGLVDDLYFARLGASRLARTLCAAPTGAVAQAMYGKMPGVAFADYERAACIVIWGANPKASNIHLMPYLRAAKRRGAFVAVVDPARNFTPNEVDLHLPVFPGADLPVALAMIGWWRANGMLDRAFLSAWTTGVEALLATAAEWSIDRAAAEARVPAAGIERLAREYAVRSPAVLRCGWGLERNRNGGQAVAALLAMPALLGKFGVRGGGYTLSNSGAAKVDRRILGMPRWETRIVNMTQLADALGDDGLAPPVKGLFIYNANPVATVPDQNGVVRGLARDDLFTVVFDQVMTDSAVYADIVLPATTFLEHRDLRLGYGSYVLGDVRPVIPPAGESRSNLDVFAALGRAMGFDDAPFHWDAETAFREVWASLTVAGGPPPDPSRATGAAHAYGFDGGAGPVQFDSVRPMTPDGLANLTPDVLGADPHRYQPTASPHPLALVSAATGRTISSTLGEFNLDTLWVEIHPSDAAAAGVTDGEVVRVHNELGEVVCPARITDRMRDGVVSIPKGAWRKASLNGQTATALCPSHVSDVGGGACFNDARVSVERVRSEECGRRSLTGQAQPAATP